jgi:polyisoprenoid-binding protein YceI
VFARATPAPGIGPGDEPDKEQPRERLVRADGELTMVGVTKPVTLVIANFVCGEQTFNKKPMCGAEATTTLKRSEWGMTNGLNIGNPGDDIRLVLPVEAYRQSPQG